MSLCKLEHQGRGSQPSMACQLVGDSMIPPFLSAGGRTDIDVFESGFFSSSTLVSNEKSRK